MSPKNGVTDVPYVARVPINVDRPDGRYLIIESTIQVAPRGRSTG
jgi:hypothetical protein